MGWFGTRRKSSDALASSDLISNCSGEKMLHEMTRSCLRVAAAAIAVVALGGCGKAAGVGAVKELCAKDGGLKILSPANVPGYLTEFDEYFCIGCVELLAGRHFDYADAHVTDRGKAGGQYFRYSLGRAGDAACESWQSTPEAGRVLQELGIKGDECVVVTELPERPVGLTISQRWSTLRYDGVEVRLNQWQLTDERTGTMLAQIKDYQFTSRLTAMLDMSGHGGNPDARCLSQRDYLNAVQTLRHQAPRSGSSAAPKNETR
jgi:hypothetical protein